jgi:hypothetical protein
LAQRGYFANRLRLESSIVTAIIAERRDAVIVSLVFLPGDKVSEGREQASLLASNDELFCKLEDAVIKTKLLWIEVVIVTAEVVLLAALCGMIEDQGRSNYTLRRCTNIASCRETSFHVTASAVSSVWRLTEIPRRAAPGVVVRKSSCGRVGWIGYKR